MRQFALLCFGNRSYMTMAMALFKAAASWNFAKHDQDAVPSVAPGVHGSDVLF